MPFDELKYPEELWEERRKGVAESLRPVSLKELVVTLKQHEEEFVDDPWRDEFVRLMQEQPHAPFYLAIPQKDIVVYYCRDADFGVWVMPGTGMGPLDENDKRLMKQAIEGSLSGHRLGGTR